MGSPCELVCETPRRADAVELADLVARESWRVDDKFSRYRADNIVHAINTAGGRPVDVDDETVGLLNFAATLYQLSNRRFDITSGVLRRAWVFDGSDQLPEQSQLSALLGRIGWQRVTWHPPTLTVPDGMEIDLGGIGKEYAVDCCIARLREASSVPCLINFGGDLATTGPARQRRRWKVGIEGDSFDSPDRFIDLKEGALATSGDARRFILKDGIRYGHILDPLTGWPVRDAPHSVTVAAATCTEAGMTSTLAMLRGPDAEAFLDAQDALYWCRR